MPETYNHDGLKFAYPDNWSVEQEERGGAQAVATVVSPETAFWSVMRYGDDQPVEQLAGTVLAALQQEYPQAELEEVRDDLPEQLSLAHPVANQLVTATCGYDLWFSYLDLYNKAQIRAFRYAGATYVVLAQAEVGELEQVEPVFQAMLTSLLQGVVKQ